MTLWNNIDLSTHGTPYKHKHLFLSYKKTLSGSAIWNSDFAGGLAGSIVCFLQSGTESISNPTMLSGPIYPSPFSTEKGWNVPIEV